MIQIKRLVSTIAVGAVLLAPFVASAQSLGNPFDRGTRMVSDPSIGVAGAAGVQVGVPLPVIIGRVINIILGFLGIILLFYVLLAGFKWMTAGGNPKQTQEAQDMIKNAVIGMVIIVSGFAISTFVLQQLTGITTGAGV